METCHQQLCGEMPDVCLGQAGTHEQADQGDDDDADAPAEAALGREAERLAGENGVERREAERRAGVADRRGNDREEAVDTKGKGW